MPLQLTTPFNVGDTDEADYTLVKVMTFTHDAAGNRIYMTVHHGRLVNGQFVLGKTLPDLTRREFLIEGADYAALVSTLTSAQGVPVYNEVATGLYQYLIDKGYYAGTIV